ncbi:Arabinose operon regulatory protein [Paraliobacillus sp. PM-2]|uniref:helix-turn-helix transcriptional regulator n=1 Tax=Paraliobacillus sp. PM-2 TaxID=1462524 RepID=UPI00061C07D4|nr:helix-turn-helix domain-containing protein [Paraliobacillus sp. PM-2]CQR47241.1 Arabinose operon regulatory protein [Paraliobacillus sp. PM-2]
MTTHRYSIIEANKQDNFTLLFASKLKYSPEWAGIMHTHPFTEIFYIIKGKGIITTNQHQFEVSENNVVIVNPNVEHMEASSSKDPLEFIIIGIEGLNFTDLSEDGDSFSFHKLSNQQNDVKFYFQSIYNEAQEQLTNYENVCHYLLGALIMKLKRQLKLKIEAENQTKLRKEIAQAKQYIYQHFKENITLDILSKLTHLNKFYLSHTFKNEIGRTPIEYLNYCRIEEAKVLLSTTNYSISQIATVIGYSSQSYFSEVFKKYESTSPSEFRKNLLQTNDRTRS